MFSTSQHSRHITRAAAPTAAALAVTALGVAPASALPEPGNPVTHVVPLTGGTYDDGRECLLQRLGPQFVRCDDLTGNGVPAPGYIPEQ